MTVAELMDRLRDVPSHLPVTIWALVEGPAGDDITRVRESRYDGRHQVVIDTGPYGGARFASAPE